MDIDLDSESASSEYSDWAEEDGRQTLKPPPRRTRQKRNKRKKRTLKVDEYDDENDDNNNEDDSFLRVSKKVLTFEKLFPRQRRLEGFKIYLFDVLSEYFFVG
jgi:hypothetical protein